MTFEALQGSKDVSIRTTDTTLDFKRDLYLSVTAGSQEVQPTASHEQKLRYRTQVHKGIKVLSSSLTLSDTHSIMTGLMSRSEGQ